MIRVVVTRPPLQSARLIRLLDEAGYEPLVMPLLDIVALPVPDESWAAFASADVVVVTSPTGAHHLVERLTESGRRHPAVARVAAVGRETRTVLENAGVAVDVTPVRATGAALSDALAASGVDGARVVLARAREGRAELATGLRAAGAEVVEFPLYTSVAASPDPLQVAMARTAEAWTVTSPKIVDAAGDVVGADVLRSATVVSIGPTTSAHARGLGVDVAAEAADQSAAGIVAALIEVRPPRGG